MLLDSPVFNHSPLSGGRTNKLNNGRKINQYNCL